MTDRELLQEILATYLVFGEYPNYLTKTLGIYFSFHLRKYLTKSVLSSEDDGWGWLDTYLTSIERYEFFVRLRLIYLKGESNG